MKKIPLKQGKFAIVDDEDFEFITRLRPFAMKREKDGWVVAVNVFMARESATLYAHHFLIAPDKNQVILHKNTDPFDLRKENLLRAGYSIQVQKSRKKENCSSKYKGVYFYKNKPSKKYFSYIKHPKMQGINKRLNIGFFYTEKEAAKAYNEKAKELYGEFAYQNKI